MEFIRKHYKMILKIFRIMAVVAIFAVFAINFNLQEVYAVIRSSRPGMILVGIALGFVAVFLFSLYYWILVRQRGIDLTVWEVFKINISIKFYSLFSPTSLVGSGIRWYRLSKGNQPENALSAITYARFLDILITIFDGILWATISSNLARLNIWWLGGFIMVLALAWFIFVSLFPKVAQLFESWEEKYSAHRLRFRAIRFINKYLSSVRQYSKIPRLWLLTALAVNILYDFTNTLSYYAFVYALNIGLDLPTLGWMRSIIALTSLIPINFFGGFGAREFTTYSLLISRGVASSAAIAFSLLIYLRINLVAFTGGIIELWDGLVKRGGKKNENMLHRE